MDFTGSARAALEKHGRSYERHLCLELAQGTNSMNALELKRI
jgi:hypothetical protein